MNIHKRTRLTPLDREEIWRLYQTRQWKISHLADRYRVSRPTIYAALKKARLQQFVPSNSTNHRYRSIQFGLKRLAKVEASIQARLKRQAQRYNKSYPGELVHFDTKRLPLLKGQTNAQPREYLFVAIDDYSRELYATIMPDKTQDSAAQFLTDNVLAQCPYQIDYAYSEIMARSIKARRTMRLPKAALKTTSAKSSLASLDLKPMVKLNVLSVLSWKCGMTKCNSLTRCIDNWS